MCALEVQQKIRLVQLLRATPRVSLYLPQNLILGEK
jgi:hypothetical protein